MCEFKGELPLVLGLHCLNFGGVPNILDRFDDRDGPETAGSTNRNQSEVLLLVAKPVECLKDHASASRTKWVTERDASAIDVELTHVDGTNGLVSAEFFTGPFLRFDRANRGENLSCESLVHFD